MTVTVHHGDSRDVLKTLADSSIDSCVTDPPYGISFMGRDWDGKDAAPFSPAFWSEVLRVLKPGAHLVAFGGTRSYHRLVCAIEDAGFEIRDQLAWVYSQGFPKSHDVSKGVDKAAGVQREVVGRAKGAGTKDPDSFGNGHNPEYDITAAARQWQGWGTALKPSYEPVCLAQKPYTFEQEWVTIRILIERLWSALWLTLPVNVAERLSALSPNASGVDVSASAQWAAAQSINTQAVLSGLTDTSQSELALITSLSTVSSWNDTLAASCRAASTSITATGSSATTDLRTLRYCLSQITPASIIQAHKSGRWLNADACNAGRLFSAIVVMLNATQELFAAANATAWEAISCPDGGAPSPNWEPICLARKPLIGTVAANVLAHGTGALNVDGCRVEAVDGYTENAVTQGINTAQTSYEPRRERRTFAPSQSGRWPANLVHDGSDEVVGAFPNAPGQQGASDDSQRTQANVYGATSDNGKTYTPRLDSGSAARFFYTAKADKGDRLGSKHPTVKPVDLMAWLCRLITPPGGTVLDPFAGSGSTGMACLREGFDAVLIEREAEYVADISRRLKHVKGEDAPLFEGTP